MEYDIAVSGAILLSGHNGYRPLTGSVGVKDGRIARVTTEWIAPAECAEWIDGGEKILMPGLVNGHCHGDMTLARGLGDDLTLLEQNEAFGESGWFYRYLTDDDRFYSRQLTYCEALLSGTTFIMENMYWGLPGRSARAMAETGIRGALAEDIRVDFAQPDKLLSEGELDLFFADCEAAGLIPVVGSVSEEDFERERLFAIRDRVKKRKAVQTFHLAENTWRVGRIQKRFHTTPIHFLYENGLLGPDIVASHVVYATDEEILELAGTGVQVVNTPVCEMKIQDGIAPVSKMVRAGVNVCLGTDGAMWNNTNDLFREMKGMSLLHTINSGIRSLEKREILDMATINGAKAFGLQKDYGTIEEGKMADFILIDTGKPHMCPLRTGVCENVTSHVVYNATGRDVTDVFVDGRHVVENGELVTADVKTIMDKVQTASEKLAAALSS